MFSYLTTLKNPIAPKSGLISPGNNAQPLPKQLQNNFEKGQKMTSFVAELAKITITGDRGVKLCHKISFFESFIDL